MITVGKGSTGCSNCSCCIMGIGEGGGEDVVVVFREQPKLLTQDGGPLSEDNTVT